MPRGTVGAEAGGPAQPPLSLACSTLGWGWSVCGLRVLPALAQMTRRKESGSSCWGPVQGGSLGTVSASTASGSQGEE